DHVPERQAGGAGVRRLRPLLGGLHGRHRRPGTGHRPNHGFVRGEKMDHQCHWTEVANIFLPREAKVVHRLQATPTETHLTLEMADGEPMEFAPGQIVELSLFGYGEIPIGFASSPTRTGTFD